MSTSGTNEYLSLAQLLPELKDLAIKQGRDADILTRVKYRAVFNAALDGAIPAERINGRWHVRRVNLPKISGLLEATVRQQNSQSRGHGSSSPDAVVQAQN